MPVLQEGGNAVNMASPVSTSIDIGELHARQAAGLLKYQRHPNLDLMIWNYTPQCQYSNAWDDYTMQCRGLITDSRGDIVARPFPRFFNLSEYEQVTGNAVPDEPFEVFEKLDGSLIIVTRDADGELIVASRGSFISEHAQKARQLISKMVDPCFPGGMTFCFELIAPEFRIVLDYGQREELVLLSVIQTCTGDDIPLNGWDFPVVRCIEHSGGFRDLPQRPNEEGYVLRFQSGLRVKVKNEEYIRLHRLLTCTSPTTIWEALRDGVPFETFLEHVPDEFYKWVHGVRHSILADVDSIRGKAIEAFGKLDRSGSRKDVALRIQESPRELWPILFSMLDQREYMPIIWKLVRPRAGEQTYRTGDDDAG